MTPDTIVKDPHTKKEREVLGDEWAQRVKLEVSSRRQILRNTSAITLWKVKC